MTSVAYVSSLQIRFYKLGNKLVYLLFSTWETYLEIKIIAFYASFLLLSLSNQKLPEDWLYFPILFQGPMNTYKGVVYRASSQNNFEQVYRICL